MRLRDLFRLLRRPVFFVAKPSVATKGICLLDVVNITIDFREAEEAAQKIPGPAAVLIGFWVKK